jgi:hypothetical protein
MIGKELVWHLRSSVLDDIVIPYLWEDKELLRFLNYAEVQACRRAHLIIDATSQMDAGTAGTASTAGQQALCNVTVKANQAVYTLSSKILQIRRCQLQSMAFPLSGPISYNALDNEWMPDWFGTAGTVSLSDTNGYPDFFLNEPGNQITFVRAPSMNDTAWLIVSRLPLLPFTLETSPEIDEKWHIDLCDWAAHLAFSKNDSETSNPALAKEYEASFTAKFGPLPDAYSERMRKVLSQKSRMRPREFGS